MTTKQPRSSLDSMDAFYGILHGVVFDGEDVFGSNHTRIVPIRKLSEEERRNGTTFSFQTSAGFLELETLQAEVQLDIRFAFRTGEENGLILYNGKPGKRSLLLQNIETLATENNPRM